MPLTNAQKQQRAREKRARTMARYEAALQRIAARDPIEAMIDPQWFAIIARNALNPETKGG
jgi:hypothetical protein